MRFPGESSRFKHLSLGRRENSVCHDSKWTRRYETWLKHLEFPLVDVNALRNEREKPSSPLEEKSDEDSEPETLHIDEEILIDEAEKPAEIDCDDASDCLSESERESLESDIVKLCEEIDNEIGGEKTNSKDNSSVDLSYQEEKALQKLVDKVKKMWWWRADNSIFLEPV